MMRTFFLRDTRGAAAAEFALVLVPLILLTLGVINLSIMLYSAVTLHFAVEDGARCVSVRKTVCETPDKFQAYVDSVYAGPAVDPVFVQAAESCGNRVTGTATYNFSTGLTSTAIPLTMTACYPAAT